ncbi:MAG: DUF3304 domain-containing protein [Burkholderiales bacterium]|nr:DUF3304 domain-containing protein [Burkholderiales bacterium]
MLNSWRQAARLAAAALLCMLLQSCASDYELPQPSRSVKPGEPRYVSLTIYGYNYTDDYIDQFEVNGQGGGNLFPSTPTAGGGKSVCCVGLWTGTELPKKVKVRWTGSYCTYTTVNSYGERRDWRRGVWREADAWINGPLPADPNYFEVHIYEDGHVEVQVTQNSSRPRVKLVVDERGRRPGVKHEYPRCPDAK